MVKYKHKGPRSKTRGKYSKSHRQRGMPNVNSFLKKFEVGDKVHIIVEPSVHHGLPHRRFHGRTGEVMGTQGSCYKVRVSDMGAQKEVLVHPVHLKKQEI